MKTLALEHLLQLLRYYRRAILWIVSATTLVTAALLTMILLVQPTYKASALVIILPTDAEMIFSQREAGMPESIPALAATHREYLSSRPVAEAVVDRLMVDLGAAAAAGRGSIIAKSAGWTFGLLSRTYRILNSGKYIQPDDRTKAVRKLMKSIDVSNVEQSFIYKISVSLPSPKVAADAANELANVYIEQAESALTTASVELGETYSVEISLTEKELADVRNRESALRKELGLQSVEEDRRALLDALQAEQIKLSDLRVQRGQLAAELEALRAQRTASTRSSFLTRVNDEIQLGEARLEGIEEGILLRATTLERLQAGLDTLDEEELPLLEFEQQVLALGRDLQELRDRALNVEFLNYGGSRIRIIDPAQLPEYADFPKVLNSAILAFVVSSMFTVFLMLLLDTVTETVKTDSDLDRVTGQTGIGTITAGDIRRAGTPNRPRNGRALRRVGERLLRRTAGSDSSRIVLTGFATEAGLTDASEVLATALALAGRPVALEDYQHPEQPARVFRSSFVGVEETVETSRSDSMLRIRQLPPISEGFDAEASGSGKTSLLCFVSAGTVTERELSAFVEQLGRLDSAATFGLLVS